MPRLQPNQTQTQQLKPYGTTPNQENLLFRERLMKRFAAHEWVRVVNIDNEAIIWQYLPSHAETVEFTPDPMKITYREDPEMYILDPGESEVLIGENAYLMIENLYKKLIAKKVVDKFPNQEKHIARSFNWTDSNLQEQYIDRIYQGKEQPGFETPAPQTAPVLQTTSVGNSVSKDLGLDNDGIPATPRTGRPPKAL